MEMPATPLSAASFIFPCSPPALLSLIPLPQEGEVFSACVLCTFSPFFCLCSRQGSTPLPSTLLRSLYLAFTTTALCCFPSYKKTRHPFPTALRRAKSFEGSLLLLTSFSASTIESLYSVFFSHFLSLMSR